MAIVRNAAGAAGDYLNDPGEYKVRVTEIRKGKSKSGKSMLTVIFQTRSGKQISGYFTRGIDFQMKALTELKTACGLHPDEMAEQLVEKECGILVEAQKPDASGRSFMQITGYGLAADVSTGGGDFDGPPPHGDDDIPF